jgi:hypothetical protein
MALGVRHEIAGFYAFDPAFKGGVTVAVRNVTAERIGDIITSARLRSGR